MYVDKKETKKPLNLKNAHEWRDAIQRTGGRGILRQAGHAMQYVEYLGYEVRTAMFHVYRRRMED